MAAWETRASAGTGRWALLHALPVAALVLGLHCYWFAVADRYAVFLYGHLGATPFDEVTSSRYWMAGLVAAGAALVAYNGGVWLLARLIEARRGSYSPPAWWRVWAVAALPVAGGIVLVETTANAPTLPLPNALGSAVAALAGLAVALAPAGWAARRPADLVWLAADGLGLAPVLLLLRAVELPGRGLSVPPTVAWLMAGGSVAVGAAWLLAMGRLRAWRRRPAPTALAVFLAGLAISYLGMPLAHHLLATPAEYRYISTASNFFAWSLPIQLAALAVAGALAGGATAARRRGGASALAGAH